MDGAAASTITKPIAGVVIPNRMIANGNQASDGIVCRPVISEPTAARSGRILDTSAPKTVPITSAIAKPRTARWRVVSTACQNSPVRACAHRLLSVTPGPGKTSFFQPDRWISSQTTQTRARAATFGHSPLQARLAACPAPRGAGAATSSASSPSSVLFAMAADLLPQPVGDRPGELGDRSGIDPPRPV